MILYCVRFFAKCGSDKIHLNKHLKCLNAYIFSLWSQNASLSGGRKSLAKHAGWGHLLLRHIWIIFWQIYLRKKSFCWLWLNSDLIFVDTQQTHAHIHQCVSLFVMVYEIMKSSLWCDLGPGQVQHHVTVATGRLSFACFGSLSTFLAVMLRTLQHTSPRWQEGPHCTQAASHW